MNRKIGAISSIVNLLAVLGFSIAMLFRFNFGSYHSAGLLHAAHHGALWRPDRADPGTVGFPADEPLFQL